MSSKQELSIRKKYESLLNIGLGDPIVIDDFMDKLYSFLYLLENENLDNLEDYYYTKLLQLLENRPFLILYFGKEIDLESNITINMDFLIDKFSYEVIKNIIKSIPSVKNMQKHVNRFLKNVIYFPKFSLELIKLMINVANRDEIFYLDYYIYETDLSKRTDSVEVYKFLLGYKYTISVLFGTNDELNSSIPLDYSVSNHFYSNIECLIEAGVPLLPIEYLFNVQNNDFSDNYIFKIYIKCCFIRLKHNFKEFKKLFYKYRYISSVSMYLNAFGEIKTMKTLLLETNFLQIKNEILFKKNNLGDVIVYYFYNIKDGESESNVYDEMVEENSFVLDILGINSVEKMSYLKEFVEF